MTVPVLDVALSIVRRYMRATADLQRRYRAMSTIAFSREAWARATWR